MSGIGPLTLKREGGREGREGGLDVTTLYYYGSCMALSL